LTANPSAAKIYQDRLIDALGLLTLWIGDNAVLADTSLPKQLRTKPHSTNPMERMDKDVKRRASAVGVRREIAGPSTISFPAHSRKRPLSCAIRTAGQSRKLAFAKSIANMLIFAVMDVLSGIGSYKTVKA